MFDPDRLYPTDDPALRALGTVSTMAHWRCEGRGPEYFKAGRRVVYEGRALNEWLAARRIQPTDDTERMTDRASPVRAGHATPA